eukprot:COSAG05_NODE_913_length_6630_cov_20.525566_4_plen_36_part_00
MAITRTVVGEKYNDDDDNDDDDDDDDDDENYNALH